MVPISTNYMKIVVDKDQILFFFKAFGTVEKSADYCLIKKEN